MMCKTCLTARINLHNDETGAAGLPDSDLIFVTDITDYNLNKLWSFIKIYAVFVLKLCGEKSE